MEEGWSWGVGVVGGLPATGWKWSAVVGDGGVD